SRGGSGDSVGADCVTRGWPDRDARAWSFVRPVRRRRVPRHGQHHSRPCSRSERCRHDARSDPIGVACPRIHAALRIGLRHMDEQAFRRGDLPEPPERQAMSALRLSVIALVLAGLSPMPAHAQGRGGGAPPAARASAPIDLTGYWVAVVNEDWRYRMVTPPKGEYRGVPITKEALQIVNGWDPAADEA